MMGCDKDDTGLQTGHEDKELYAISHSANSYPAASSCSLGSSNVGAKDKCYLVRSLDMFT